VASGTSLLANASATTALLTHDLDQLDEDARMLVADLSLLDHLATFPLLSATSELSTERLERALAKLLHRGLLVACPTDEGGTLQFRHPLYRELAYDRQLQSARERRHSRCADALIAERALSAVRCPS
jgi:predicted ATPase